MNGKKWPSRELFLSHVGTQWQLVHKVAQGAISDPAQERVPAPVAIVGSQRPGKQVRQPAMGDFGFLCKLAHKLAHAVWEARVLKHFLMKPPQKPRFVLGQGIGHLTDTVLGALHPQARHCSSKLCASVVRVYHSLVACLQVLKQHKPSPFLGTRTPAPPPRHLHALGNDLSVSLGAPKLGAPAQRVCAQRL